MPESEYIRETSPASALQINVISEKISDIGKKLDVLSELPAKMERLSGQIESLNRDHGALDRDMQKCQSDIHDLEKAKNQMDTVKGIFGACGMGVVIAIWGGWTSLSAKLDATNQQAMTNKQSIENVEHIQQERADVIKDMQERQRQTREEIVALQTGVKGTTK